jgi:lysophospholipase L1-like esterase
VNGLPGWIETFRPDVVTVLVGVDDAWTIPSPPQEGPAPARGIVERHSRAYRAFLLLRRRLHPVELETSIDPTGTFDRGGGRARYGDVEVPFRWTRRTAPDRRWHAQLDANLRELIRQGRELGVQLVLLTYPTELDDYGPANSIVRLAAHGADAALVDLAKMFGPSCPVPECPELLLPDHHPNARGHRRIAEMLLQRLRADEGRGPVRGADSPSKRAFTVR